MEASYKYSPDERTPFQKQSASIRPWTNTLSKKVGQVFVRGEYPFRTIGRIAPIQRMDFASIRRILSNLLNVLRLVSWNAEYSYDSHIICQCSTDVGHTMRWQLTNSLFEHGASIRPWTNTLSRTWGECSSMHEKPSRNMGQVFVHWTDTLSKNHGASIRTTVDEYPVRNVGQVFVRGRIVATRRIQFSEYSSKLFVFVWGVQIIYMYGPKTGDFSAFRFRISFSGRRPPRNGVQFRIKSYPRMASGFAS